jgi:hypothetical protein
MRDDHGQRRINPMGCADNHFDGFAAYRRARVGRNEPRRGPRHLNIPDSAVKRTCWSRSTDSLRTNSRQLWRLAQILEDCRGSRSCRSLGGSVLRVTYFCYMLPRFLCEEYAHACTESETIRYRRHTSDPVRDGTRTVSDTMNGSQRLEHGRGGFERPRFYRDYKFWLEIAMLLVVIAYTCATFHLARETRDALDLQSKTGRAVYDPKITFYYITAQKKGPRTWVELAVRNDGPTTANHIAIAERFEFLPLPPTTQKRFFAPGEFKLMQPSTAHPSGAQPRSGISAAPPVDAHYTTEPTAYVWGQIRYIDFTDEQQTIPFCFSAEGGDVLSKAVTSSAYAEPWTDCNE